MEYVENSGQDKEQNVSQENNTNDNTTQTTKQMETKIEEESEKYNIDDKIIEFQNKLDKIITLKNEGNVFFKSSVFDDAIEKYSKAKELIEENDELFSKYLLKANEKEENLKIIHKSYLKEKIAIISNLSLIYFKKENFELSIENDLKVK